MSQGAWLMGKGGSWERAGLDPGTFQAEGSLVLSVLAKLILGISAWVQRKECWWELRGSGYRGFPLQLWYPGLLINSGEPGQSLGRALVTGAFLRHTRVWVSWTSAATESAFLSSSVYSKCWHLLILFNLHPVCPAMYKGISLVFGFCPHQRRRRCWADPSCVPGARYKGVSHPVKVLTFALHLHIYSNFMIIPFHDSTLFD